MIAHSLLGATGHTKNVSANAPHDAKVHSTQPTTTKLIATAIISPHGAAAHANMMPSTVPTTSTDANAHAGIFAAALATANPVTANLAADDIVATADEFV